ncbi:Protein CBG26588 [Caenorhabditis briggsae]|uniref:Protein CBG26588 n=1 Tax=Caenorhabditis briggsae TaxID=6238 RepID=B6IIE8_CAEBR|nr:Protein CBG26588 [Caenorhabditis briggsae]CAR99678.1 Protein CBG26588 [Caenorhabditis briggsae]
MTFSILTSPINDQSKHIYSHLPALVNKIVVVCPCVCVFQRGKKRATATSRILSLPTISLCSLRLPHYLRLFFCTICRRHFCRPGTSPWCIHHTRIDLVSSHPQTVTFLCIGAVCQPGTFGLSGES